MTRINLTCPRGLGDIVIAMRIAGALARRGAEVGIRSRGSTDWIAAGLPAPDGVGRPLPDAQELDLCDSPERGGWDYSAEDRFHARIAARAGLRIDDLGDEAWLPVEESPTRDDGDYLLLAPRCSKWRGHLSMAQVETIATVATGRHALRCIIVAERPIPGLPEDAEDLTGQTTVADLCALIAGARVVVSTDSGPLHVAGACRAPLLAIVGATLSAAAFARDYAPSVFLQARPFSEAAPEQLVDDLLALLVRATGPSPRDVGARGQWARRMQARIDEGVTAWRAQQRGDARPVAMAR